MQLLRHIPEQEFRWPDVDGREVRTCLRERGSFVLRNAIDPDNVSLYRDLVDRTHGLHSINCAKKGLDIAQAEDEWSGSKGWKGVAWALKFGQVMPGWLADCFPGRSFMELIDTEQMLSFLTQFFGGPCRPASVTHARRVHPNPANSRHEEDCGSEAALQWHVDAHPHGATRFRINLWTPLEDCGVDRPGLQAGIMSHDDSVAVSGYEHEHKSFAHATHALLDGGYNRLLDDMTVYAPILRAGDVFVFSHWTLHSTYVTPKMKTSRLSVELRFEYDGPEFPLSRLKPLQPIRDWARSPCLGQIPLGSGDTLPALRRPPCRPSNILLRDGPYAAASGLSISWKAGISVDAVVDTHLRLGKWARRIGIRVTA